MHLKYKPTSKSIKKRIRQYIPLDGSSKYLSFIIYYEKLIASILIITNNPEHQKHTYVNNVVYELSCPLGDCISNINNNKKKINSIKSP